MTTYKILLLLYLLYTLNINYTSPQNWNENSNLLLENNPLSFEGRFGWGKCYTIANFDSFICIGNGTLFQIFDISDTSKFKIIGELLTENPIYDIKIKNHYAFITSPFQIIDIENPRKPVLIYQNEKLNPQLIEIYENYAYLGNFDSSINVLDITDERNPLELTKLYTSGPITSVAIKDTIIYCGTMNGLYLEIFNIKDIYRPMMLNRIYAGLNIKCSVNNEYLYLTGSSIGLHIYNIQNSINPVYLSEMSIYPVCSNIKILNSNLYLTLQEGGILLINISDKNKPKITSSFISKENYIKPNQLTLINNEIYSAAINGLLKITIKENFNLLFSHFFITGDDAIKVSLYGNFCFIVTKIGLTIFDYKSYNNPTLISHYIADTLSIDFKINNDFGYLLTSQELIILDIKNPDSVKKIQSIPADNNANYEFKCFDINDNILVIADNNKHFKIFELDENNKPILSGILESKANQYKLKVVNYMLYSAEGENGFTVYDIRSPYHQPIDIFNYNNGFVSTIQTTDSLLFTIDDNRLIIFDLKNKNYPSELSNTVISGNFGLETEIASSENYLYISHNYSLSIVDYQNPTSPSLFDIQFNHPVLGVDSNNDQVIIANGESGVILFKNKNITSINIDNASVNHDIQILNYPNPFNSHTNIIFFIKKKSHVSITIYNSLGKTIKDVDYGYRNEGYNIISIDNFNEPSGIYFLKFTVSDINNVIKIIHLK